MRGKWMNNQDLAKIVRQVQMDKEEHFEELFNETYRTVYYLSFKLLNNETEAQDVSQEIIFYIYDHIEELKLPEGFNNWMNRIIYSRCANRLKQILNRREDDYKGLESNDEEQISDDTPEEMLQTKEKNQFVLEIINELPIKQKEVILLYYYQQLTTPEIAEVLSCSIPSVQNRLHKAKKSIRKRIEKTKIYTTQQLFGIGGLPLLLKILTKEANTSINNGIQGQLWTEFTANKYKVKNRLNKENYTPKRRKNKTNSVRICFALTVGALLFVMFFLTPKESTEKATSKIQEESQLQPEVITQSNTEEKRIPINKGIDMIKTEMNERIEESEETIRETTPSDEDTINGEQETISNVQVQTEEKRIVQPVEVPITLNEERSREWYIANISIDTPLIVWVGEFNMEFTNTAIVIDKDWEALEYVEDNNRGASVYKEEIYKKKSTTTYHTTAAPAISFKKSSTIEQDVITYYLELENIGEVAAHNIQVKDEVPQYTAFVKIIDGQHLDNHLQVPSEYNKEIDTIFWNIDSMDPNQKIILAFQVKIKEEEYRNNRDIKNIAYMKVVENGKQEKGLPEEQNYIGSNEIIYRIHQQENRIPKTSDNTSEIGKLLLVVQSTFFLIVAITKKKNGMKKSKN